MITAIGTSHTADTNGYTDELAQHYSDGTVRWTDSIPAQNLGIPQLGINTYFPRIQAAIKRYPNTKLFLIEIPTGYRQEYPVQIYPRVRPETLTEHDFWFRERGKYNVVDYHSYIHSYIRMGNMDWKYSNLNQKMAKVNDYAEIGISKAEFNTLSMIQNKWDYNVLVKETAIKIEFIYWALQSKGYDSVYWHMDPDPHGIVAGVDVPLINKYSVVDYFEFPRTPEYFYDSAHLNTVYWDTVVQEYFKDEIQRLTSK
jgi:hypothetical protein